MEPLKEGESICPVCNGSGESRPAKRLGVVLACKKCRGHGKLDWVEMIVGKRSWRIRPGVFVQTKLSPDFEQYVKEIRESIIKNCGIQLSYLGIKT